MKILFLLTLQLYFSFSQEIIQKILQVSVDELLQFNKWKTKHKKHYFNIEEASYRQTIFLQNLKQVIEHNQNENSIYEVGINQFSDLTKEEFAAIALNNLLITPIPNLRNLQQTNEIDSYDNTNYSTQQTNPIPQETLKQVPQSFDWRGIGKVSPVKNQGTCGSCWAFTTTGLFESINLLRNNTLQLYSEQELIDCSSNGIYYNQGCLGGWPSTAHYYVQMNGLSTESQYPYQGIQNNCSVSSSTKKEFHSGEPLYFNQALYKNKTNAIQYYLTKAPIAVLVDASNWGNYKSGVFSNCTSTYNHAALLIGYTKEGNWIIKNSWGATWGDQGYITITKGNTCGIEDNPLSSTI